MGGRGSGPGRYRIGVDVGGTFTDFVMADLAAGGLIFHKEPSVPADPSRAVASGVAALLERAGAVASDIALIAHGTTLALNAVIQERGSPVALVVSRGNRDVMELARGRLPNSYNFRIGREKSLVPRENVYEIGARMMADGTVEAGIDEAELDRLATELGARGFGAVAVMLLNSYRDPTLETAVAEGLRRRLPDVLVSASATLWPELREYERALIAVLNAYVHPLMASYLDRLTERLAAMGVTAPVTITSNNGGAMSVATARERPIDTILSGPASGVRAAAHFGDGLPYLLTFDMGGTSTDVATVTDGEFEFARTSMVGDYPLMLPVVNVSAVGAGGGSLAWLDGQGILKVGPDSAGADPGPISYGRGGSVPTITDALLVLGVLHPDRFLGGRMKLDAGKARAALSETATSLGLADATAAADAIIRIAAARMSTELTKFLAQKGTDPRDCVLIAFGGAGPTMANILADEAHVGSILIPPSPGTFCALGALISDVRRDFVRPARVPIGDTGAGFALVSQLVETLRVEATAWIVQEGELIRDHAFTLSCDMRYPGQSYELPIGLSPGADGSLDEASAVEAFHLAHERAYGFREVGSAVEVMNVRLAATGLLAPVPLPDAAEIAPPAPKEWRRVHLDDGLDVPVYDRAAIGRGARLSGPAIVEQLDTTTLALAGWDIVCDRHGSLRLERTPA
ncbi:hydantoinase/oxoprolinase family protein [Alsobacter sp. R-9]